MLNDLIKINNNTLCLCSTNEDDKKILFIIYTKIINIK